MTMLIIALFNFIINFFVALFFIVMSYRPESKYFSFFRDLSPNKVPRTQKILRFIGYVLMICALLQLLGSVHFK